MGVVEMTAGDRREWTVVSGYRERRERMGLTQEELANEAGIKDRGTVIAAEKDPQAVRPSTRAKIERTLERLEEVMGIHAPSPPSQSSDPGLIEFEVTGDFGVRVVVKGPVGDADALERSVARLVRDIRDKREDES